MDCWERGQRHFSLLRLERSPIAVASCLNLILTDLSERERRLSRGESLFRDGDPVESLFLVVTGELRVTRLLPHGVELTLQRPAAGAIVHESSLFAERYVCDARATRSSSVRTVPVQRLLAAFCSSCELAHRWARHLEGELHRARTHAEILSLRTVAERLNAWCAVNSGCLPPRGHWHRLAEEIGVSAEALYRELHGAVAMAPALRAASPMTPSETLPPTSVGRCVAGTDRLLVLAFDGRDFGPLQA